MMNQFLLAFVALSCLAAPAAAQPLSSEALAKQSQAIAVRVQRQLMACWNVPPGAEGMRLSIDIVFFGDGSLDGEPVIAGESRKLASKNIALQRSITAAVMRCTPFSGLEALGAGTDERFSVTIHFQS